MADFDLRKFFRSWQMWLVALALLSLWCVPPLQLNQAGIDDTDKASRASLEDQYRRTLAQILGGLALLYGLYLTHRRIVATEENVRVAQEGQVTERFTRAIEQLGHQEMEIRLGGIYALERLAKDSEKDHSPIMEVLTAYVREKATKHGKYAKEAGKPTTDIQAILTVIGRRKPTDIKSLTDFLDLSDTHLAGADLSLANLSGVSLFEADLSGASLNGADLSGGQPEPRRPEPRQPGQGQPERGQAVRGQPEQCHRPEHGKESRSRAGSVCQELPRRGPAGLSQGYP